MKIRFLVLILFAFVFLILLGLRIFDTIEDRREWSRLRGLMPDKVERFDPKKIKDLPEPARRYFQFAIQEGTPLWKVAELEMGGKFSLGTKEAPNYQNMLASQILASPEGFVWQMELPGFVSVSGSDSGSWTRFRILHLVPVARLGGDMDHSRAAFGRYIAEAIFWTPAAILPSEQIKWEKVDSDTARLTVTKDSLSQSVDVRVNSDGSPKEVFFLRWSNANKEKTFKYQPFGGKLSDFREVEGFRIPFYVEAANFYGSEDEFVFFKAEVKSIKFLTK